MSPNDLLPWLNLLLVPMAAHVLRVESRIGRMEAQIELLLKKGYAA